MILINLLPHREAARKRRKEVFQATLGISFVCGLLIAGAIYSWFQMMITDQQSKNAFLKKETVALEEQIKEIATIEEEIMALQARQNAVENLQADRNLPVHLLTQLVKQMPSGSYVSSLKQTDQTVAIQGMAQSNERVSEMLRNFTDNTPWFSKPELIEIAAKDVAMSAKDKRRASAYNLRFSLIRASELKKDSSDATTVKSTPTPGAK